MIGKKEIHRNKALGSEIDAIELLLPENKGKSPAPFIKIHYRYNKDTFPENCLTTGEKILTSLGKPPSIEVLLYGEKLALFQKSCAEKNPDSYHKLSPELLEHINSNYADFLAEFKRNKFEENSISQNEINDFYDHSVNMLQTKQQIAKSKGKPLLLLIGENHYEPSCRFVEHVYCTIAKDMGMKTIGFEYAADGLDNLKYTPKKHFDLTSINMSSLYDVFHNPPEMQIHPLENKIRRKVYDVATMLKNNSFGIKIRDEFMAPKIAQLASESDVTMAVVGADHLQGILKQKPALSDIYEICIVDIPRFKVYSNSLDDPKSEEIPLRKPPIFYSNREMHQRILQAREKNLEKSLPPDQVYTPSDEEILDDPKSTSEAIPYSMPISTSTYTKMFSKELKSGEDRSLIRSASEEKAEEKTQSLPVVTEKSASVNLELNRGFLTHTDGELPDELTEEMIHGNARAYS